MYINVYQCIRTLTPETQDASVSVSLYYKFGPFYHYEDHVEEYYRMKRNVLDLMFDRYCNPF